MEVDAVIPECVARLPVKWAYAPLTLASYRRELERLAGYLRGAELPIDVAGITTPRLRRHLGGQGDPEGLHTAVSRD